MRRAILTCIVLLAGSSARGSTVEPATEPGDRAPELVKALPSYAPFSITGVAWHRGRLYVGTNIGLLVVRDAAVERVVRWNPKDAVLEGPWLDRERDVLWLQEDATGDLRRFDGQKWARSNFRTPASRGATCWAASGWSPARARPGS